MTFGVGLNAISNSCTRIMSLYLFEELLFLCVPCRVLHILHLGIFQLKISIVSPFKASPFAKHTFAIKAHVELGECTLYQQHMSCVCAAFIIVFYDLLYIYVCLCCTKLMYGIQHPMGHNVFTLPWYRTPYPYVYYAAHSHNLSMFLCTHVLPFFI
jgi:hypothetical protein